MSELEHSHVDLGTELALDESFVAFFEVLFPGFSEKLVSAIERTFHHFVLNSFTFVKMRGQGSLVAHSLLTAPFLHTHHSLPNNYVPPLLGHLLEPNLLAKGTSSHIRLIIIKTMKAHNPRIASITALVGLIQQTKANRALVVIIMIINHFQEADHPLYLSMTRSKHSIERSQIFLLLDIYLVNTFDVSVVGLIHLYYREYCVYLDDF